MTQHVIGFFCGTGYTTERDASFQNIETYITNNTILLGYDGCQIHGGGFFSYGVEEQADAFLADLKAKNIQGDIQLNLVAHSRGVLSAILAIKKIQADPELKDRISITVDFRDPVPGNFQLTAKLAGNLASANVVHDLSGCPIVKKAYITLQEKPIVSVAFDALVPKFHHSTGVEIETLPGYHDAQQRSFTAPGVDHTSLLKLGNAKTLNILSNDGHIITLSQSYFLSLQLRAYDKLVSWAKTREQSFGERDLHFGGSIIANNTARTEIEVINWRHARLKKCNSKSCSLWNNTTTLQLPQDWDRTLLRPNNRFRQFSCKK